MSRFLFVVPPLASRAVCRPRWAVTQAMASGSWWASCSTTQRRMRSSFTAQSGVAGSDSMRVTLAARSGWRAA